MRPSCELTVHPFDAVLRVVLGVGEVIVQFAAAERLYDTILSPTLGAVEKRADDGGEVVQARVVHRGRHVRQMGALPPVRQRIRMMAQNQSSRHGPPSVTG